MPDTHDRLMLQLGAYGYHSLLQSGGMGARALAREYNGMKVEHAETVLELLVQGGLATRYDVDDEGQPIVPPIYLPDRAYHSPSG